MEKSEDTRQRPTLIGEEARQGEIILNTRTRRLIFIAGIVGLVVLGFVIQFATLT
ncbi:peptide ABC transporter permease [Manganibacter manganicus]|uniref:Peptide ABC transporter permease n=1 Tax=Manganibacter manganicus TaxID=1873176 RepID=A0A1V8RWT7_9HYPH|nr:peptide ABC transporter permease [Pseudaminobacter manganicus]OQM77627.1 peptide ABC transporter permease [Pseudaminobacter manganicus]